ncbi:MAG: helix-turn-helix domain-containing protein [Actinomycetota bacterium]
MSPDYVLDDELLVTEPGQFKAIADPLRSHILDLALERAVTVGELADALDRPKSSVAYHVDTLVEVGLLAVVRTRRVRAIDERFFGRTARTFVIAPDMKGSAPPAGRFLTTAMAEVAPDRLDEYVETLRHVRLSKADADVLFERIVEIAEELTRQPHSGDTIYGFVAAIYPTNHPVLGDPHE